MSPLSVVPFNPSVWNSQRSLYFHAAPPGPNSWLWSTLSQAWPADSKFLVVTLDVEKPIAVLPTNGTTSPDTVTALDARELECIHDGPALVVSRAVAGAEGLVDIDGADGPLLEARPAG